MPVRPKRSNPISTRPVYLPRVPAKELQQAAKAAGAAAGAVRIFFEADAGDLDVETLAKRLEETLGRRVVLMGEPLSALAGRPQTEVRQRVAAAANAMAWARVRDVSRKDYRVLPLRSEVDQEEATLRARSQPEYKGLSHPRVSPDFLYNAAALQGAYRELLGEETALVVTDRRLAWWSAAGGRWSETELAAGIPTLLSVVNDPARRTATLASDLARALRLNP